MSITRKIFDKIYFNPLIKYIPTINNKTDFDNYLKNPELAYLCKNKIYIKDNKEIFNLLNKLKIKV